MTIFDQIWLWISQDTMDFILTVFVAILFFEGLIPVWYDRWQDKIVDHKK